MAPANPVRADSVLSLVWGNHVLRALVACLVSQALVFSSRCVAPAALEVQAHKASSLLATLKANVHRWAAPKVDP